MKNLDKDKSTIRRLENTIEYLQGSLRAYEKLTARLLGEEYVETNVYSPENLFELEDELEHLRKKVDEYAKIEEILYKVNPDLRLKKYKENTNKIFIKGMLLELDKRKKHVK